MKRVFFFRPNVQLSVWSRKIRKLNSRPRRSTTFNSYAIQKLRTSSGRAISTHFRQKILCKILHSSHFVKREANCPDASFSPTRTFFLTLKKLKCVLKLVKFLLSDTVGDGALDRSEPRIRRRVCC